MDYTGVAYLGIDAGSTTFKGDAHRRGGQPHSGVALRVEQGEACQLREAIAKLYNDMPVDAETERTAHHHRACPRSPATASAAQPEALRVDSGEIETVAHACAALNRCFRAWKFILDIGSQDIEVRVKDGVIDHIMLNRACSSGL